MIIKGADILTPYGITKLGIVVIENGIIARISPMRDICPDAESRHEYEGEHEVVDGAGLTLVPGFIDIHAHGGGGCDTLDKTYDSLERMCLAHAAHGTTGILPTTMSGPAETLKKSVGLIGGYMGTRAPSGAGILGIHLEGPWLNPEWKGAQPVTGIREPSVRELDELVEASSGNISMITLAPEMPGALDLIKHAVDLGIKVSLGHSSATYDQAIAAADAGATHVTHAYNAMSGLHHRRPGMVGAMLSSNKLTVDVILDGFHIHLAAAKILMKCKGKDGIALITDATMAAGMPDGEYELGGQRVICRNGAVRLPDGILAGSALTLDKAVKYAMTELDCSLEDAIKMTSETPAWILGIDDKKGSIEVGKDADLVLLDAELQVVATMVRGSFAYVSEDLPWQSNAL